MKWFCNLSLVDLKSIAISGNVCTWLCVGLGLHHRPVKQLNSNWYEPWRTNSGAPGKAHPSGGGMKGTITSEKFTNIHEYSTNIHLKYSRRITKGYKTGYITGSICSVTTDLEGLRRINWICTEYSRNGPFWTMIFYWIFRNIQDDEYSAWEYSVATCDIKLYRRKHKTPYKSVLLYIESQFIINY